MWKTFQGSWYIVNNFHGILYIRCEKRTEIIEKTFMTDTAQASCEI